MRSCHFGFVFGFVLMSSRDILYVHFMMNLSLLLLLFFQKKSLNLSEFYPIPFFGVLICLKVSIGSKMQYRGIL